MRDENQFGGAFSFEALADIAGVARSDLRLLLLQLLEK